MKNIANKSDKILKEKQLKLVCGGWEGHFDFWSLFKSKKSCPNSVPMQVLSFPEEFNYHLDRIKIFDIDGSEVNDKRQKYEIYIMALKQGFPANNARELHMYGKYNPSDENDHGEHCFFTDHDILADLFKKYV